MRLTPYLLLSALALAGCSDDSSGDAPHIVSIAPNRITVGTMTYGVIVDGRNFTDSSIVLWNGVQHEAQYWNERQMYIPLVHSEEYMVADTASIQVVNTVGADERSNKAQLIIAANVAPLSVLSYVPSCCREGGAGDLVGAYFSEALDSAALTDSSIMVYDAGVRVPGGVTYNAATHSLWFDTPVEGLKQYTVALGRDVVSLSKGGVYPNYPDWHFSTTRGELVVLDEVGEHPSMVLGTDGRPRIAYGSGGVKQASCTGDCTLRSGWTITTLDGSTGDYTVQAAAARSADGTNVAYWKPNPGEVHVVAATGGNATVDTGGVGSFPAIVTGAAGQLHLVYFASGKLKAGLCNAACGTSANWTRTMVDSSGTLGGYASMAVGTGGAVYITYFNEAAGDLRYASCAAPCTTQSWTLGIVDSTGSVGKGSTLLVDGTGMLRVVYYDKTHGTLRYGTCTTQCDLPASWTIGTVTQIAAAGTDMGAFEPGFAIGTTGQLEIAYMDPLSPRFAGASCATACTAPGAWTTFGLSLRTNDGARVADVEIDAAGARHVAWTDAEGMLHYMKY